MSQSHATTLRVNTQREEAPVPLPAGPAQVIRDDAEAIAVAHRLAESFAASWTPFRKADCGR